MKKTTNQISTGSMLRLVCFLLFLGTLAPTVQGREIDKPLFSAIYMPPATITGKVTDAKNAPLEGVSVSIKGSKLGVVTDAQGSFTIKNVPDNGILVFSYTGFGSKEVAVKSGSAMSVSLTEQAADLNDVVVTGYGTSKRKDLTGAITQVKASRLENENPRSVQDMLRGNAPGLSVGFDPSTKGQGAELQLRGQGSLTASSSP